MSRCAYWVLCASLALFIAVAYGALCLWMWFGLSTFLAA